MNFRNSRKHAFEIFSNSFSDIMFFLMLFFLIASTMITPGTIKLILPQANQTQSMNKPPKEIAISVTKDLKYYINNKEKIITRNEEYKQKHKEYLAGKAKENHEKNKDKIKETQKAYYQENNFYVKCECGANVQKISMTRHLKSQKHIKATDKI